MSSETESECLRFNGSPLLSGFGNGRCIFVAALDFSISASSSLAYALHNSSLNLGICVLMIKHLELKRMDKEFFRGLKSARSCLVTKQTEKHK